MRRIQANISWLWSVLVSAAYRFYWDDCFSRASSLAYATLFALVPVSALSFSMFAVFGLSAEDLSKTLRTILEQVLPPMQNSQLRQLQEQVLVALEEFSLNVRALNTLSIGVLVFTAVALLNTIESALNVIWRVSSNLGMLTKVTSFWAVITLGPLFVAISIYWTTKVKLLGVGEEPGILTTLTAAYVVPVTITWVGLALLYYKLPAAKVQIRDALLGAFISAVLFECVKSAFAHYIGISTTYSTVYGVLASFPLFLFWLYVAWVVVLFGAEVSYQSGAIHIMRGIRRYATDLGETGALLGLRILLAIGRNFRDGKTPPTESEIAIDSGSDPVLVRTCLNILAEADLITRPDEQSHTRSLLIQPDKVTLGKVFEIFRSKQAEETPVPERAGDLLRNLTRVARQKPPTSGISEWSLQDLLEVG